MTKPKQPPKPACASAEARARQALEARIAELQIGKDALADRLTLAEAEREDWRKEAADAHSDAALHVATQTFELGKRDSTIARLESDRDYDRERFAAHTARLESELEAAKTTIDGLARQIGILSAAAQTRANNDAADAARSNIQRQKEPCGAGHPTSDPTGF